MEKVVQFESFASVYNDRLQEELLKCRKFTNRFELVSLNLEECSSAFEREQNRPEYASLPKGKKIAYWTAMNRYMTEKYKDLKGSTVHIQFVASWYLYLLPFLKKTFGRMILSFWGSDLLRQSPVMIRLMAPLFQAADRITFETSAVRKVFETMTHGRYNHKLCQVRFGLSTIPDMDSLTEEETDAFRREWGISRDKTCVAVGYNRRKEQQHIPAIHSMLCAEPDWGRMTVLLPWSYGQEEEHDRREIGNLLADRAETVWIDRPLNSREMACLWAVTDILIQVQTTDSLSSSMLEALYSGCEVITGQWLPYQELYDLGIRMRSVPRVEDVGVCLREALQTPLPTEARENNRKLIRTFSGWEENIQNWVNLY